MAPLKTTKAVPLVTARPTISTRSRAAATNPNVRMKRKADASPGKETAPKRSALGDISNNVVAKNVAKVLKRGTKLAPAIKQTVPASKPIAPAAKPTAPATKPVAPVTKPVVPVSKPVAPAVKSVAPASKPATAVMRTAVKPKGSENLPPPAAPVVSIVTRATAKQEAANQTAQKPKELVQRETANKVKTRLSNEFEKAEETLYSSALEELASKTEPKSSPVSDVSFASATQNNSIRVSLVAQELELKLNLGNHEVPPGVSDFDKENLDDIFQCPIYAMDIFNYLKDKEMFYQIPDYMERQVCMTPWMRSLLVDWMVEVQESFELNHETLYLGVKLVDTYLSKVVVGKEALQLLGAAAMFIACKYDERIPPLIDDFLYICDGAYEKSELIKMEISLLKVCEFDLGIPLSYRFMRRYARCGRVTMPVLTLARFILEYNLMNYAIVTERDSKLAAAALYLAIKMKKFSTWTEALQFYSGYTLPEIMPTVYLLNDGVQKKHKGQLLTVRTKYSHKIFYEVAKTPLLKNEDLL